MFPGEVHIAHIVVISINFAIELKFVAKYIDIFYFIGYYYHIVNDKHQLKREIHQKGRKNVDVVKLLSEA